MAGKCTFLNEEEDRKHRANLERGSRRISCSPLQTQIKDYKYHSLQVQYILSLDHRKLLSIPLFDLSIGGRNLGQPPMYYLKLLRY